MRRLLTSKLLLRRRSTPPLTPLPRFLSSSPYHHRHQLQHDYTAVPLSPRGCIYIHRHQFSTRPEFSEEFFYPVSTLISLLDSYHQLTGLPWWIVISSSTVALRLAIFPLIVLQLRKLKRIGELLPKLPPPFPPPLSARSFRDQFTLFWNEKKAAGCPSVFWFFLSYVVQVPCFFLWLMSVRIMSLDRHPGFDCGGTLWFQDLTEYPHGELGPIFPLFIAGLHLMNVQLSFQKSSLQQLPGSLELLAKLYRIYLQLLTLPILIAAFNVPQGSLVYWLTNSSLSLIQMLCLRNPGVIEYLGLPKQTTVKAQANKEIGNSGVADVLIPTKEGGISALSLSAQELVAYSIKILTDGHKDAATRLLRLALQKDPRHVRALFILGQTLLENKQFAEATECLESAISKLVVAGYPKQPDEVYLLILSSQWAGVANLQQGKMEEGLQHLERIAQLAEPEDEKRKAHYYEGLFVLSSALLNMGRKADALKYMRQAAAYDPAYNAYFEHLDTHLTDFAGDLANSRRDF